MKRIGILTAGGDTPTMNATIQGAVARANQLKIEIFGLIKGFTGVSDPYEEPRDADLVLDTSAMTRDEAVGAVLKLLVTGGWLAGAADEPNAAPGPETPVATIRLGPTIRRL